MARHNAAAQPFDIAIDLEGRILVLRMTGDVDKQNIVPGLAKVAEFIRRPGKQWLLLADFSGLRLKAHPSMIKRAGEFAKGNKPYVLRAAAVGVGSSTRRFLYNRMVALSGRDNLRAFEHREDAEAWLFAAL